MKQRNLRAGFVLPFTLIICIIILTVSTGISIILAKEMYFSKLSRQSQVAYYAADNGLMCATMIDDHYVDPSTGIGIFEYRNLQDTVTPALANINIERTARGYPELTLDSVKCASSEIFTSASDYALSPFLRINSLGNQESGRKTTFSMRMDLGSGTYRCANIEINKTETYRQIISKGFASCTNSGIFPVERAIVSTTEAPEAVSATQRNVFVLNTGTSWRVPTGVTNIQVWAIGGGGGGAGSSGASDTAGGGGGAGGVAYNTFTVTPGQFISYSLGASGVGGDGGVDGGPGGETIITIGNSIRGKGGTGGKHNNGQSANGGNSTGGLSDRQGGQGAGASGDMGGGGGGGIGGGDGTTNACSGGTGGESRDISGLFAVLSDPSVSMPVTSPGTGPGCATSPVNGLDGTSATGFGAGGGGAGYFGGEGGDGYYGGGGGGAAGGGGGKRNSNLSGGKGGNGVIIISAEVSGSGGNGGGGSKR